MIIGLTGKLESGKDTIADYLVEKYGFDKVGFMDEMYRGVCGLFGIDLETALRWKDSQFGVKVDITSNNMSQLGPSLVRVEHVHLTWREFLQRFGTEMARECWDEDFWIDRFERKYLEDSTSDFLVVKDVRLNNEALCLGSHGGTIWEVLRPGKDGDSHLTEAGIDERHIDGEIMNNASLEELYETLDWWMKELTDGR